ncbi:activating signal cointegrator 1 complex subunit 2 [Scaptodrosophila lebanonensis]|uniref:Activating signal cointegrator 1 complex subunit 2 n=1 Tax=Drosophila lebanonensis TaxID=7225 RepID=A0A6J2TR06_DROLE|nr:activating signal cointegrator 1 complex subunit 2 [Scaptodrosophila lebanonensis]
MLDNTNCNPDKLSLGDLKLELTSSDGVKRQVPALDEHWITRDKDKPFQNYVCMLCSFRQIKSGAALEEWLYIATCCQQDLEYLLGLSHHVFWSHMVYEESAMNVIVTFLQRANPYYRTDSSTGETTPIDGAAASKAEALYAKLLNLVVRVILRLLTAQESPTEWIIPEQHGDLLYKNYLISVPLLFDLVVAVGDAEAQNVALLEKIFTTVLRLQPNYLNDFREGLAFYENAFLSMQIQVDNEGCEGACGGSLLDSDAETPYDDVVLFALDCAYTLRVLLKVCPALTQICEETKLPQCIANFYDLTVPMMYKNICLVNPMARSLKWLNEARQQFINAVRSITHAQLQKACQDPQSSSAQKFVELLQECLTAHTFVVDYERQYPVEHDVQQLLPICPSIKDYKVDFVVAGYQKVLGDCTTSIMAEELSGASSMESLDDSHNSPIPGNIGTATLTNGIDCSSQTQPQRDFDLEATAVLDVLPDLGRGFIQRVLKRYENSEQAIAAILDDNLPPDLINNDRQEIYIPEDPQDKLQKNLGLRHFNVHDGDRYDVLTQEMPQCIIKQGKGLPGKPRNAEQMLDDKRHIGELKERYQKYALVEDQLDDGAEYEDEYDDSYEALIDGQAAPLHKQRRQQFPDAGVYEAPDNDDDEDDDGSSSEGSNTSPRDTHSADFCENPEVIRARYAARQQAKWGNRGAGTSAPPPPSQRDVVGAAKGQGQSRETQRNRGQKEAHKSSRANHNRKAGAAYKRSKGMLS